jgi:hypothetical protein
MVLVEPTNLAMLDFKGLHLYHAHISNCSARVRLLLEEKKTALGKPSYFFGKTGKCNERIFWH